MRKQLEKDNADPEKANEKRPRDIRTSFDGADRHWQQIVTKALVRPFKLFFSEPIVQLLGVYMAFVYGLLYRECDFSCAVYGFSVLTNRSLLDDDPIYFRGRVPPTRRHCGTTLHRSRRRVDGCIADQCAHVGQDIPLFHEQEWRQRQA